MNFAILSFIIGFILQFEALFLLLPWIVGMIYGEYHVALIYLVTAAVCFILGKLLSFKHTGRFKELYVREGFTAVALGWFVMSVFGAIPFVLTREIPFYIDALFETISGFTTTGSSILSDVEALSYASLFWRSFTHWIGGIHYGDPADDGWLHYEPDACGEPGAFRQQAGTESPGYGEDPLWNLSCHYYLRCDRPVSVRHAVI
jgi:Trk-type K+ transport system membrane component